MRLIQVRSCCSGHFWRHRLNILHQAVTLACSDRDDLLLDDLPVEVQTALSPEALSTEAIPLYDRGR